GPDAVRDYQTRKPEHIPCIGVATPSAEGTSDANASWCLAAPPSHVSPRRPHYAGEIGWGVWELSHFTRKHLRGGAQIKRGPIRQAAEDKATHWYQSPWQPAPYMLDQQGHNARARLAWDL
ncbi:Uncharacterized protein C4orf45, partial [Merops nubicus]